MTDKLKIFNQRDKWDFSEEGYPNWSRGGFDEMDKRNYFIRICNELARRSTTKSEDTLSVLAIALGLCPSKVVSRNTDGSGPSFRGMKTILRSQNYLGFDLFFQAFPSLVPLCPVDKWVPFFPHINMDLASVFVAWAPDGSGLVLPNWMPSFHVLAIEDGLKRNFFGLRCQPNSSHEPVPERIEPIFLVTDQNPSLLGHSMYLVL